MIYLLPVAVDDPPPDYTEKPSRSDHMISVLPRLSSVEESHEPLSPPSITVTTTLEASTSHNTSNHESVRVEVNTNIANQEAASSEQTSGETVVMVPVKDEVSTETANQEMASTNITLTVDTATSYVQSNWKEADKPNQSSTAKSFTIQATPHRNISLSHKEEIESKLTATL